jgi:hypothetical protein
MPLPMQDCALADVACAMADGTGAVLDFPGAEEAAGVLVWLNFHIALN